MDSRILIGRLDGENVATAMAFDHDGDRGIYNVGTLDRARRRGLGTGLTALLSVSATSVDSSNTGCEPG